MLKLILTVADKPTGLTAVRTGYNVVELSWYAPAKSTPPIAGYEVFYAVSGIGHTQSRTTTTNTTNATLTGLALLNTSYDIFVVAFSDAINTLPSERSETLTLEMSKCAIIINWLIYIYIYIY